MSKPKKKPKGKEGKNAAAVTLGGMRWNDISAAERTRHAKAMLAARWSKPRTAKKKTRQSP